MPLPAPQERREWARLTLAEVAYRELLGLIVRGELAPGDVLREDDLASWLGISRTPLRDALARLEDVGLVRSAPRRGTWVTDLDPDELSDTAQAMAALLGAATRLAWPHVTAEDVELMLAGVQTLACGPALIGSEARRAALRAIVEPLLEASGNPVLQRLESDLRPSLLRMTYLAPAVDVDADEVRDGFTMLDEALRTGRPLQVGHAIEHAYLSLAGLTIEAMREQQQTTADKSVGRGTFVGGRGRVAP